MRKMLGNKIGVFLKTKDNPIVGLLIDVTDDSLYLQENTEIFIIPKANVNYCTSNMMPPADRILKDQGLPLEEEKSQTISAAPPIQTTNLKQPVANSLKVIIDDYQVADIPVPPSFDLSKFHDDIIRVIMGNPDVYSYLSGRVQKEIEYYPGMVYIRTVADENIVPITDPGPDHEDSENTFSMSAGAGGQIMSKFLNPLEMVTRLQNATKRGKNNDDKTKV